MPADYAALKPLLFDGTGRMMTTGLFKETRVRSSVAAPAPFSIMDWHKIYIDLCDPTEYAPAMELLGNWNHWVAIRKNKVLAPIFDEWKIEVEVKIRSEAVRNLIGQAATPSGSTAAKWLAEAGFNPKDMRLKKSRQTEDAIQKKMADRVEEDFNRITEGDK